MQKVEVIFIQKEMDMITLEPVWVGNRTLEFMIHFQVITVKIVKNKTIKLHF